MLQAALNNEALGSSDEEDEIVAERGSADEDDESVDEDFQASESDDPGEEYDSGHESEDEDMPDADEAGSDNETAVERPKKKSKTSK